MEPDYSLVPVEHDPFADVGASMARHLTGNPTAGPGQNPAQAFLDWRNSGQSWADQYHDYAQRAVQGPQAAIETAGNPMDLFGGFVGSTAPEAGAPKGITAYHGSPYDFSKFDLSKIGTGEGAQAYGHGLYFAENEGVAQAYKKALTGLNPNQLGSGKAEFGVNNVPMPSGIAGHAALDTGQEMSLLLGVLKDNPDSTMIPFLKQKIENRIANHYSMQSEGAAGDDMRAMAQYYNDYVKNAKPGDVSHIAPGKMYQVSIAADPEHFLDWDKPLSEQPNISPDLIKKVVKIRGLDPRLFTGADLYNTFSRYADKSVATDELRSAGIPGIKYLDQGSRGSGAGTHNYVVFDDNLINIIKKYGIAGLIAGGGAHFSTTPVDHDPYMQ